MTLWHIIAGMSVWQIVLVLIVIGLVALPQKWDPAIRLKEWLEDRK